MTDVVAKPVARPRPAAAPVPPPLPFPTVAVKVAAREEIFYYCATDGVRSWSGSSEAPTREAVLLDVFSQVRADIDGPIRFAISVLPASPIWRHIPDLQTALGCLVERARLEDLRLMGVAVDTVAALLPEPVPVEPAPKEQLTVATDGSVRDGCSGYGWLANDGRYRLHGSTTPKGLRRREAILLAELNAIDSAVRSLPGHPLVILTDSVVACKVVGAWLDGTDIHPPGFRESTAEQHPLTQMRDVIHASRDMVTLRWVKGHGGHLLNEGADALARLASRYARGDSDLTDQEYGRRAAGLAESFAAEFSRAI